MVRRLTFSLTQEGLTYRRPAFHDGLDFISVQERLFEEFQETFSILRGKQKQSLDAQVDAVMRVKATTLKTEGKNGLLGVRGSSPFLDFC